MPNFGWHLIKTRTKFTLEELYKNVQIFPTNYNVTELPGESKCTYNINKINYNNVYINIFSGVKNGEAIGITKNLQFHLKRLKLFNYVKSYKNFYLPRFKNKIKKS